MLRALAPVTLPSAFLADAPEIVTRFAQKKPATWAGFSISCQAGLAEPSSNEAHTEQADAQKRECAGLRNLLPRVP